MVPLLPAFLQRSQYPSTSSIQLESSVSVLPAFLQRSWHPSASSFRVSLGFKRLCTDLLPAFVLSSQRPSASSVHASLFFQCPSKVQFPSSSSIQLKFHVPLLPMFLQSSWGLSVSSVSSVFVAPLCFKCSCVALLPVNN